MRVPEKTEDHAALMMKEEGCRVMHRARTQDWCPSPKRPTCQAEEAWREAFAASGIQDTEGEYAYRDVPEQSSFSGWNLLELEELSEGSSEKRSEVLGKAFQYARERWKTLVEKKAPEFFATFCNMDPALPTG